MIQTQNSDRILFLDNLRYLLVLLVVILHATMSYSKFVPWWCVKELNGSTAFFDALLLLLDVFLMPSLFFIAGYFAVASYLKNGAWRFLNKKFRRLGLPLLIAIPLVSPTFSYIYKYNKSEFVNKFSFGDFWTIYMAGAADVQIRIMDWISHFNHAHLWFISLLLFFFIVFTSCAKFSFGTKGILRTSTSVAKSTNPIIVFAIVSFLSAVSTGIASLIFPNTSGYAPWINISNLLIFQPSKVISFVLYFCMGVYGYHKKWFIDIKMPGHLVKYMLPCILLSISYLVAVKTLIAESSFIVFLLYLACKALLSISALSVLTIWAHRSWNNPSQLNKLLASNSYNIYILHFLILILLQQWLTGWTEGSTIIKFSLVSSTSILLSYGISQYVIRPYPRLSVLGIYSVFIIILFTH